MSKAICMYWRFVSDIKKKKKKGIINIKLIIIRILCHSFFQKASPKTSSEDWQNVTPILSTGNWGEKKMSCQRSHYICDGTPQSWSTDRMASISRHHTFKHTVSLKKNTVFENHFESNKYRGKYLFRRRGETNLRWEQEINSLRRKRETANDWHWSSSYLHYLTPDHQRTGKGQKLLMWSVVTWKISTVLNREIQYAANKGSSRSGTVFSNKSILEPILPSIL